MTIKGFRRPEVWGGKMVIGQLIRETVFIVRLVITKKNLLHGCRYQNRGKEKAMKERSFDEMVAYFNRRVSEMDIAQDYKMELLGMVTALGYKHEKTAQQWIPCSERLPSKADHTDDMVLVCYRNGSVRFNTYMNGWVQGNPVAWMPLPEPYKERRGK